MTCLLTLPVYAISLKSRTCSKMEGESHISSFKQDELVRDRQSSFSQHALGGQSGCHH